MARILVIEDEARLSRAIAAILRASGHAIDVAANGEGALAMLDLAEYNLLTLDLGLPDMPGIDLISTLRRRGNMAPILVVTAQDALSSRVAVLNAGADDYVLKPFEPAEFEARVRMLLRRAHGEACGVIAVGSLQFDEARLSARIGSRALALPRREWALLGRLVMRAGRVVSRDRLTSEIFECDEFVGPNVIDLYISRLRRRLAPDGPEIRTIRGLGYMLLPGPAAPAPFVAGSDPSRDVDLRAPHRLKGH